VSISSTGTSMRRVEFALPEGTFAEANFRDILTPFKSLERFGFFRFYTGLFA
jgi:hypothetical protein